MAEEFETTGNMKLEPAKGAEDLGLLNSIFLECHSLIAEILNASRMGEFIGEITGDWRHFRDKASNGRL